MANVIDIVVKATDQTGGKLSNINSQFQKLTGFSLSAAGAIGMAGKAVDTLYKFVRDSVVETEKYVTSITDMSRVLGMSTEETSRLVQAADDLFITQEKLNTAMLAASRQGTDVSIEGLKDLSEQYLKLNPGVERAEFLMKKFGRSGSDMGKMMEIGADGIDAATAAIKDSLIVTAESEQNIRDYKQAVDELNDAWTGVKLTVGNEMIPTLTVFLNALTGNNDGVSELQGSISFLKEEMGFTNEAIAKLTGVTEEQVAAFLSLDSSAETAGSAASVLAGDVSKVTQYFKDLTAEMIFNKIAATMDADAQMDLAYQMGLINDKTYFTLNSIDQLTAKYDLNKDGVIDLTEKTGQYDQQLAALIDKQNQLTDKTVTYTIYTNQITNGGAQAGGGQIAKPGQSQMEEKAIGGYAAGGNSYLVGERGPELFTPSGGGQITPNNQLGGGGFSQSQMSQFAQIISVAVATEIQKLTG